MNAEEYKKMKIAVQAVLEAKYHSSKRSDGRFHMDIYADHQDKMSSKTAAKICGSKNPWQSFWDWLGESYLNTELDYNQSLMDDIQEALESNSNLSSNSFGNNSDAENILEAVARELVCWNYPAEHFLRQKFCVNIILDTGDGVTDYSLNSPYPCWYGRYEERLDNRSSLLWLARQQGKTKTQLWHSLRQGDMANPKGFLESCRVELANLKSSMAVVVFLVKLELRDLIELNRCIQLQDRNGYHDDTTKNPYCGYIVVDKSTMTGLYDPWYGSGSELQLELERDVRIPIRFIRSALPDGCDGHGIGSIYGMCESAWRNDVLKIYTPKNIVQLKTQAG